MSISQIGPGWLIGPGWNFASGGLGGFGITEYYYYYLDQPGKSKSQVQQKSTAPEVPYVDWSRQAVENHSLEQKLKHVLAEADQLYPSKKKTDEVKK